MSGNDTDNESNDEDYGSDFSHAEVRHATVNKALNHLYEEGDDQLLFGSRKADINLSTLHPEQVQIFRLWQIYLDNVSPLLKVTHTPTLQPRIIDAAGHIASINPPLEALMFSIYCISTLSLSDADFRASFGLERKGLLTSYQYGCQQALLRCRILRSSDRDCLTALYLYLVSHSYSHSVQLLLMLLAFDKMLDESPIAFFDAGRRHPHSTAHGHTQRVRQLQIQRF